MLSLSFSEGQSPLFTPFLGPSTDLFTVFCVEFPSYHLVLRIPYTV